MADPNLIVKDWQKDCVYLIQFPRAGCIPSISSYCLKMETWLRMAEIPYQNVDNQFKHKSERGQLPFIELNGRQICDTNYIISELTRLFNVTLDDNMGDKDTADYVAYHALIEDSLSWIVAYYRSLNVSFLSTDEGLIGHFSGWKRLYFRTFLTNRMKRAYKARCKSHGIGRLPNVDVLDSCTKKLKAISTFLDNKKYMMGDHVTSLDATAFGHLCMFYYCPLNKDIKNFMETDCRNIADYLRNIKDEFWSDWNECTAKLSLATKPKQLMPNGYPLTDRLKSHHASQIFTIQDHNDLNDLAHTAHELDEHALHND